MLSDVAILQWLVQEVLAKSFSKCECHCRRGVQTPGCWRFRRPLRWRVTSRTSIHHIYHSCCDTAMDRDWWQRDTFTSSGRDRKTTLLDAVKSPVRLSRSRHHSRRMTNATERTPMFVILLVVCRVYHFYSLYVVRLILPQCGVLHNVKQAVQKEAWKLSSQLEDLF